MLIVDNKVRRLRVVSLEFYLSQSYIGMGRQQLLSYTAVHSSTQQCADTQHPLTIK
jgi:hypothetical protein